MPVLPLVLRIPVLVNMLPFPSQYNIRPLSVLVRRLVKDYVLHRLQPPGPGVPVERVVVSLHLSLVLHLPDVKWPLPLGVVLLLDFLSLQVLHHIPSEIFSLLLAAENLLTFNPHPRGSVVIGLGLQACEEEREQQEADGSEGKD